MRIRRQAFMRRSIEPAELGCGFEMARSAQCLSSCWGADAPPLRASCERHAAQACRGRQREGGGRYLSIAGGGQRFGGHLADPRAVGAVVVGCAVGMLRAVA